MSAPEERSEAPEPKRQRGASDADASVTPPADSGVEVETAPAVSVIMPCRNAMPWLPDCVASVLAQRGLAKRGGLELIAVDDSSTDGWMYFRSGEDKPRFYHYGAKAWVTLGE